MQQQEAEVQATANLSPVSPSPLHTAATPVASALQNTVDTIDAMVAVAEAPNGIVDAEEVNSSPDAGEPGDDDDDDLVDDDSFDDAYGDDIAEPVPADVGKPEQEQPDSNDDYAKMFDSPVNPEEDANGDAHQEDVSSVPRESNDIPQSSSHLQGHPGDATHVAVDTSSEQQDAAAQAAAQLFADIELAAPTLTSEMASVDPQIAPAQSTDGIDSAAAAPHTSSGTDNAAADIEQLVADLTAQPAEPTHSLETSEVTAVEQPMSSGLLPSALAPSSSLPPRPPQPQSGHPTHASQHHPTGTASNLAHSIQPAHPGQPSNYVAAGAPGTSTEATGSLPPPPSAGSLSGSVPITPLNAPSYAAQAHGYDLDQGPETSQERAWEQFTDDERQYMAAAKWDRFPEGSRIFIGNLSSDKVSKREVFDLFHRYGRLAQISLKSAYGFVQYHTMEEGRGAMENLQGIEVKGRRIHLEISRVQEKSKKERRSPDRGRANEGRRNDRYANERDDYRPRRNNSPRRSDAYGQDENHGRDRGHHDSRRGRRSRSPSYGRSGGKDSYRRRSPSPYGRSRSEVELDIPRRYGADVPDVQMILQPDMNRDFVAWVEGAFKAKGLKTEMMYLHPRFPKEQVIQRQAAEGVHAVVDLDMRAQHLGRIPVKAFDRSGGSNVRFEEYVDLEPNTAAEVILRAKASGAPAYGQPYGGPGGYSHPYTAQQQQQQQQQQQHPAGGHYAGAQQPGPYAGHAQAPPANTADIAGLMGQMDNATLQRLLSAVQGAPQGGGQHMPVGGMHPGAHPAGNPQVDIQALLGSLGGAPGPQQAAGPPQAQYGAPYGAQGPPGGAGSMPQGGDSAAQVQNIMAQLARYRQ